MKFTSPHFKNLHVNGAGTFADGELTVLDDDERALSKVRAVADAYGITEAPDGPQDGQEPTEEDQPPTPPSELKGAALEAALRDAGLPLTGTADDKRIRLVDWLDTQATDPTGSEGDDESSPTAQDVPGPAAGVIDDTAPDTGSTTVPDVLTSGTVPSPA